ncbi:unnamed protein product [Chironomus riparius]|uniref:Lipase domain-containing protein n=1 Tax=Chironomus riparius TaxID=315576 RepID=A0A9N9RRD3_9DIPT|nr:unnamed protein product [Chironomus riparius]
MLFKSLILLSALVSVAHCDPRLRFIFYYGSTDFMETAEFSATNLETLHAHPAFQRNIKTVMFHYGVGQSVSSNPVFDIITSYLFNREYNFVVISYENNNVVSTDTAVDLAEGIASALIRLFDVGYSSGNMNLLGFSLGAQIVARASRRVQAISNRRHIIGRLTGLDPFNIGPISAVRIGRMSSADAQWVESIHTENPNRGDHLSTGHVQFYFNGGISQPQCTQISPISRWDCSHDFALIYWAESVRSTVLTFPALQCSTWELYTAGSCNSNSIGHMGRTTESNLRGAYFLRTSLTPPYARNTALP